MPNFGSYRPAHIDAERNLHTSKIGREEEGQAKVEIEAGRGGCYAGEFGESLLTGIACYFTDSAVIHCLQEVAGNHGVAMWGRGAEGFATDPIMVENHLIFVATRIQMRMTAYPKWCA